MRGYNLDDYINTILKMKHPFTPAKKKAVMPIRKMKSVRIDSRTVILADAKLTDEEVRGNFIAKRIAYTTGYHQGTPNYPIKQEFKEVPVGEIVELEAILDKDNLPEIE
jgi:hypothetical protein